MLFINLLVNKLIVPKVAIKLDHLSKSHQQWEVNLVSVSQDLQDAI